MDPGLEAEVTRACFRDCSNRLTRSRMSDRMVATDKATDKRVTIRLAAEDMDRVNALSLGDETLSQTIRRVLRESSERLAIKRGKKK